MLTYRKDLDGLRALAVIAVFMYHAKLSFHGSTILPGGFLGVDIFFVLSGFLITGILAHSFDSGNFAYKAFYWRRFKRIVPALLVVLSSVTAVFLFLLLPSELENYLDSFVSALFFLSNFHFLMEDSYSAEVSMYKPLLHTWTLAVEWQYYLLFPILFSVLARFGRDTRFYGLVLLTLISFVFANIKSNSNAEQSFYMLPFRFWELSLGGLLAITDFKRLRSLIKKQEQMFIHNGIGAVGLLCIFTSFIVFDDTMMHPSYITLLPVMGTCCLIFSGTQENWFSRLISSKSFVYTGLISYSLYLWHQPILVLYRLTISQQLDTVSFIAIFAVSYLLSMLTFHGVERVFKRDGRRHFWIFALYIIAIATYFFFTSKHSNDVVKHHSYYENLKENIQFSVDGKRCHGREPSNACSVDYETSSTNLILLGDSHAGVLGKALHELAADNKYNFRNYTAPGCKGVVVRSQQGKWHDVCQKIVKKTQDVLLAENDRQFTVVYSIAQYRNVEGKFKSVMPSEFNKQIVNVFEEILNNGHNLVLVYPIPGFNFDVPKEIKRRELNGLSVFVKTSFTEHTKQASQAKELFDAIQGKNVFRVYPEDIFCNAKECMGNNRENIFYYDDNHLSLHGSKKLVDEIKKHL